MSKPTERLPSTEPLHKRCTAISRSQTGTGARPSPSAATPDRVGRQELSTPHPAADVAVPETGTLRSAGLQPALALGLCVCFFAGAARGADLPLSETNLIPANLPLWTESMLWDEQISLSSGVGYKDNVLLSAFNSRGSAFFINGLDATVIRLPLDGWQVEGSVTGDDTRYWRDAGTSSEDSFLGSLRVQRELAHGWKPGLEIRGLYENQVLDISPSPALPATALVQGESLTAKPSLRKDLPAAWWLQLEMPVTRWWLAAPLDDQWQFGPVATVGHDFGPRTEITLSGGVSYEEHNSWLSVEYANGQSGPDFTPQKLEIFQERGELAWRQYWDVHQRWRSATRLICAKLEDNGGGYYNQHQYQAVQDLRWQTADWLIKGAADLTYEDYPVQWIGKSNGETLNRTLWNLSLELERRVYKHLKTWAKLDYQRAVSNEDLGADNYRATTVSGGLRWEF